MILTDREIRNSLESGLFDIQPRPGLEAEPQPTFLGEITVIIADGLDAIYKSLEIVLIVAGGISVLIKLGKIMEAFANQEKKVIEIGKKVDGMTEVMTAVAVQNTKIDALQGQIEMIMRWYDELRHGRGYITSGPD